MTLIHTSEVEADELAKKFWSERSKGNHCKGMKNTPKKNIGVNMENWTSSKPFMKSSKSGESKHNKLIQNSGMKNASKKKNPKDMENQISHQNAQTSSKKSCLKAVKKKPTVHTVCNRNTKEKRVNKGTESNDMVCVL